MRAHKITILLSLIFCIGSIKAQSLIRGPYLQSLLPTGITIMWRTDVPTPTKVEWGTSANALNNMLSDTALVSDHIAKISGLNANAKYFYRVSDGVTNYAGGDDQHHFTTAPEFESAQKFRFWALGDFGASNQSQIDVRRSFLNYSAVKPVNFWIWLGDNTYTTGKDSEYQRNVFSNDYGYDSLFRYLPFYPAPGNHDYGSVVQGTNGVHKGPYFNIVEVFQNGEAGGVPSGTEKYYSYNYGNVHFISLNSEAYADVILTSNDMKDWLINDLQQNTQPWTVAYWHQPPYSKGSHDSDASFEVIMRAMRENYLPILEEYGVDIVINGHSHVYERSYMLHGHYGKSFSFDPSTMLVSGNSGNFDDGEPYTKPLSGDSSKIGTVYIVCGNGGKSESSPLLNHPVMYTSEGGDNASGSLICTVEGNRFDVQYLRKQGTVADYFTILKTTPTGVNNNILKGNLKLYPNPASNAKVNLELELSENEKINIEIFDINGKKIQDVFSGSLEKGFHRFEINTNQLSADGSYLVRMDAGHGEPVSIPLIIIK